MYTYCPRCGNKISKKQENLFICNSCGLHIYENPRPTTAVIFEDKEGKVLLVKRNKVPKKGYWDVPGGFIDLEETLEEGVRREIKEELNIKLKEFKYIGSYFGRYLYKGFNYHTLCFAFIAKLPDEKITTSNEISEVRFFPKQKIPLNRIAFIEVKNALKDYLSSFQHANRSPKTK